MYVIDVFYNEQLFSSIFFKLFFFSFHYKAYGPLLINHLSNGFFFYVYVTFNL